MKLLLIFSIFYINYVLSENEKYAVKRYPKKVISSGKILVNSKIYPIKKSTPAKESKATIKKYTAFQSVDGIAKAVPAIKAVQSVPDSPYFPLEQPIIQKPRVKKVLPDYLWSGLERHKRSLGDDNKPAETPVVPPTLNEPKSVLETPKAAEPILEKSVTAVEVGKTDPQNDKAGIGVRSGAKKAPAKQAPAKKAPVKKVVKPKGKSAARKVVKRPSKKSGAKKPAGTQTKTKAKAKPKPGVRKGKKTVKVPARSKPKGKAKKPLRKPAAKKLVEKKQAKPNLKETRRLTSAREALIEEYPYMASIQKDGEHWCSGALLNPRIVITTANCLWKSTSLSRMEVRVGSSYTNRGGQLAGIQEVMKHPRWGLRKYPDNDIALILLDKNIKFSHSVHGVDLPNRAMLPAFEDAWVTSWGSERRDGIYEVHEENLQVYHAQLMSRETCNNLTQRFGITVSQNFICFSQSGKHSPCTRDTGAPAVSDGVLWGVASWGIRKLCGTERFPSMFSYLASHSNMDFIANATSQLMADQRFYPYLGRPVPKLVRKLAPAATT